MKSALCGAVALAFVATLLCGCDPVRTTVQPVIIEVRTAETQESLTGMFVGMRKVAVHDWEAPPWFCDITDEKGRAAIPVRNTALDTTRGRTPPSWWREVVVGRDYLVRIANGDVDLTAPLTVEPGAVVEQDGLEIEVVEIRPPFYVPTSGWSAD